jgi:outer membrane protein W
MLLLVPAATASASGGWLIDARAGVGLPMGDFGDVYKSGLMIGVEATKMMSTNLGIGVDGGYIKNSPTDDYQAFLGAGTEADAKFMRYGVHGKYMLGQAGSKMMPYFVAGAGMYNIKEEITPPGGPSAEASETDFGIRGGMGMNMMLGQKMGLGFQADFNDVFTEGSSSQFIGLSAGLHWNLTPSSSQ